MSLLLTSENINEKANDEKVREKKGSSIGIMPNAEFGVSRETLRRILEA